MWLFGGEFTTPNGSQFKTYRDLRVLRFAASTPGEDSKSESKCFVWEEIKLKTGPPARSGHRMIYHKRKLIVFGGFFDNGVGDVQYCTLLVYLVNEKKMVRWYGKTNYTQPSTQCDAYVEKQNPRFQTIMLAYSVARRIHMVQHGPLLLLNNYILK